MLTLKFQEKFTTIPVEKFAHPKQLQHVLQIDILLFVFYYVTLFSQALESLPNSIIPKVSVTKKSGIFRVTFTDTANGGRQQTMKCNHGIEFGQCEAGVRKMWV